MTQSQHKAPQTIAANRKARRDYHILERLEAGIELRGTEVKSVKAGEVNLPGAFASIENGELVLRQLKISAYEHGNRFNHDPTRVRRLLLHKKEIQKLQIQIEQKGCALVPLRLYLKKGRIKVELALCKGKQQRDKRETLKRRTAELEARRAIRRATR